MFFTKLGGIIFSTYNKLYSTEKKDILNHSRTLLFKVVLKNFSI